MDNQIIIQTHFLKHKHLLFVMRDNDRLKINIDDRYIRIKTKKELSLYDYKLSHFETRSF